MKLSIRDNTKKRLQVRGSEKGLVIKMQKLAAKCVMCYVFTEK